MLAEVDTKFVESEAAVLKMFWRFCGFALSFRPMDGITVAAGSLENDRATLSIPPSLRLAEVS